MPFCRQCGKEVEPGASFCPVCGAPQGAAPAGPSPAGGVPEEAELRAFVGEKAEYYLPRFSRFTVGGVVNFAVTWHWPAFFVPLFWMLYRKMYLWALAVFVSHMVPWLNLIAWFGWPMVANYLYFREARAKAAEVRAANPGGDITPILAAMGGVNRWVWPVAIVLTVLGLLVAAALLLFGCLAVLGSGTVCGPWGSG